MKGSDRRSNGSNGMDNLVQDAPSSDKGSGITGRAIPSMDTSNLAGFKSTKEMIWSPTAMFDSTVSYESSCQPSRTSTTSQPNTVHSSTIPSPSPDHSAILSMPSTCQHTPRPMTAPTFTYMNYSPTASVGGESMSRQSSNQAPASSAMKQQSTHFQGSLEGDPFVTGNRLTQSLYAPQNSNEARRQGMPPQSMSLRNRFGKFFSIFLSRKSPGDRTEKEEFTEIFTSDVIRTNRPSNQRQSLDGVEGVRGVSGEGVRGVSGAQGTRRRVIVGGREVVEGEIGVEAKEEGGDGRDISAKDDHNSGPIQADGGVQSMEGGGRQQGEEGVTDEDTLDLSTTLLTSSTPEPRSPLLPASFPRRAQRDCSSRVKRRRASQSDSVEHTVLQVQERLKQLAESQNFDEMSQEGRESKGKVERSCDTPKNQSHTFPPREDGGVCPESYSDRASRPIPSVDSTHTLIGSVPSSDFVGHHVARSLDTNEAGESSLSGSLRRERRGSHILMRRVSVCDHKGESFGAQTSAVDLGRSWVDFNPSPVLLLDQLVNHGEIMHKGNAQDIPLTELEGIDWFRFGGCPHNEELGQMQSQVALLHSQLLFERYQCLQHARRNRRLLSKARNAHRVKEELEYLVSYRC